MTAGAGTCLRGSLERALSRTPKCSWLDQLHTNLCSCPNGARQDRCTPLTALGNITSAEQLDHVYNVEQCVVPCAVGSIKTMQAH